MKIQETKEKKLEKIGQPENYSASNRVGKFRMLKWAAILLPILLLAQGCSFFGGGGNTQGPEVTLVIWKLFDNQQALAPVFTSYRQLRNNVQFQFVEKDIATYENDLLNALATGAGPDIFTIHNDWLPRYQDKMSPAPEELFTDREIEETFVDVVRTDLYGSEGELYALPLSTDVLALYYNRDLLGSAGIAQPPSTWDEILDAVKKLTQQDRLGNFLVHGIALGTADNINRSTDILSLLMLQNGTQVYNQGRTQATLATDIVAPDGTRYNPGEQALEFYTQFSNPAKPTYTWNNRSNYSVDSFAAGQTAMMISYWYMGDILRDKAPLLNFGVAPVPQIDVSKPKINYANYFAEGVSRMSPNSAWAWDFLKFASSAESLNTYYGRHLQPASRKDLISQQIVRSDLGIFAEGALTARSYHKPDSARVERIFADMINDVVVRGKSPENAVSDANRLLNELLR